MKLLVFNIGYGKGWTSPLRYLFPTNVNEKISKFVKDVNPDVAALCEVDTSVNYFGDFFESSLTPCKYGNSFEGFPFVRRFGNGIYSKKKCELSKKYLSSGAKKLVLEYNDSKWNIILVHLSLASKTRTNQIRELSEWVDDRTILVGDFNVKSDDELNPLIKQGLFDSVNQPTFPSWNPSKKFDRVLLPKKFFKSSEVLDVKLSDHLPVLVTLK